MIFKMIPLSILFTLIPFCVLLMFHETFILTISHPIFIFPFRHLRQMHASWYGTHARHDILPFRDEINKNSFQIFHCFVLKNKFLLKYFFLFCES